ncbi:MAG: DUF3024 domain-containing protein [Candidatus Eisenbacteria bacterium]
MPLSEIELRYVDEIVGGLCRRRTSPAHRNERQDLKWHRYDPLPETSDLGAAVAEVDVDPYGCFFG